LSLAPSARAAGCPNEAIRAEQGAAGLALPDCRAYELVTPGSPPFISTDGGVGGARASTNGDGLAYFTRYPSDAANRSGYRYLTTRAASGWSTEDLGPQDTPWSSLTIDCEQGWDFSPDLSKSILADGWKASAGDGECGESEEVLAPGAPKGYANLYLREGGPGTPFRLVNATPEGAAPANAILNGYTPDLSHILFSEEAPLTQGAPSGNALYEWSAGTLKLVSVLPSGEPVAGNLAYGESGTGENNITPTTHAYSNDGEEVFFYANGNLYLRRNATQAPTASGSCTPVEPHNACTIQVDLKQGGTGTSGGGLFWAATADGSKVLFSDESKLTAGAGARAGKPDLYEYNVTSGLLRDRTPVNGEEGGNVRGFSGMSEDGSVLYFVALGVIAGAGANGDGELAQPRSANLYRLSGGEISFIATLDQEADFADWGGSPAGSAMLGGVLTATSPSGRYLEFASVVSLTGFDNAARDPRDCVRSACRETFLYDAQAKGLECVSCGPTGTVPAGDTEIPAPSTFTSKFEGGVAYYTRQVFDDGRVFFTTPNALAPQDANGTGDVYEFQGGQSRLISSGTGSGESAFVDADPGGANAFFATSQGLVRSDTDNRLSIYDARVDGGFSEPPPPPACEGESCRGETPAAPTQATPGSANFAGAEEGPKHPRAASCKAGYVKQKGKCVKKKSSHKKKKRSHKKKKSKQTKKHGTKHAGSKRRNAK